MGNYPRGNCTPAGKPVTRGEIAPREIAFPIKVV